MQHGRCYRVLHNHWFCGLNVARYLLKTSLAPPRKLRLFAVNLFDVWVALVNAGTQLPASMAFLRRCLIVFLPIVIAGQSFTSGGLVSGIQCVTYLALSQSSDQYQSSPSRQPFITITDCW